MAACPGDYCGVARNSSDINIKDCSACQWGYRARSSVCSQCDDSMGLYDWMFLGFMALLPLVLHFTFIDLYTNRKSRRLLLLHLSALLECSLSAIISVVVMKPTGSLALHSCSVRNIRDWYTLFYNPRIGQNAVLHCTQEAVFPLYTIVMIYYALQLLTMALIRPLFANKLTSKSGVDMKRPTYAALYFLPILVLIQALTGGLLYYSFPFVTLFVSVVTLAVQLSLHDEQTTYRLLKNTFTSGRNLAILFGHWFLHGYGILSIVGFDDPVLSGSLMLLVPIPFVFYVLTSRFTHPDRVSNPNSINRIPCCQR